jgi:hypothetical protein
MQNVIALGPNSAHTRGIKIYTLLRVKKDKKAAERKWNMHVVGPWRRALVSWRSLAHTPLLEMVSFCKEGHYLRSEGCFSLWRFASVGRLLLLYLFGIKADLKMKVSLYQWKIAPRPCFNPL